MRILLVDDEKELREALSQVLEREGYVVETAKNGKSGLQLAQGKDYDLLILDWMLPEYSGLTICQKVRATGKATPVLILTAKDTVDDRVQGLDAGADDYLVKPFELRELLARVRALLRRSPILEVPEERLKIADLDLDKENQVAYRNGRMIRLSDRELQLLTYFMENAEQLLTHEQIYQHLWQDEAPPSSNVLAALIRLLRRKVETKGDRPLIHTVYGKGYYFGLQDT
ncbi:two-component system response regulator RppA [[Limnothrix rosea] IAM M-220]|uniref:two-component system response regulator RppA n=1 Tax=[Limnothrix rosea] IAM M-220 TaxID=454133 RepID=UPI000967E131|nr:two-component system response regulator RppA [[Limnothrix rosea] IAM M-220]OKH18461.1 DNA-binding response regulator [[Limnothrix rosea] IAM M-220]